MKPEKAHFSPYMTAAASALTQTQLLAIIVHTGCSYQSLVIGSDYSSTLQVGLVVESTKLAISCVSLPS